MKKRLAYTLKYFCLIIGIMFSLNAVFNFQIKEKEQVSFAHSSIEIDISEERIQEIEELQEEEHEYVSDVYAAIHCLHLNPNRIFTGAYFPLGYSSNLAPPPWHKS